MKEIAIGLSVTLNVITFALVIWIWSGNALKYLMRFFIRPMYERWVSQFERFDVQPGDTVFLGDSITEGGSWHELFPHSNVRNRGIGGDVTAGVLTRLDRIITGQPAQLFLLIGTNDLSARVSQTEIVANIVEIVDRIRTESPPTEVFVQSILPRGANFRGRIETLNTALETAIAGKAAWVNLYPLFLDEAKTAIDDSLSNDNLHLMGKGYLIWRDAIEHLVNKRDGLDWFHAADAVVLSNEAKSLSQ